MGLTCRAFCVSPVRLRVWEGFSLGELGKRELCNDFMGDLHVVVSFFPPGQSNPLAVQGQAEAPAAFLERGQAPGRPGAELNDDLR